MKFVHRIADRIAGLVAPSARAKAITTPGVCEGGACGGYGEWISFGSRSSRPGRPPCC